MKKEIFQKVLRETPELLNYAMRKVKTFEQLDVVLETSKEMDFSFLNMDSNARLYFTRIAEVFAMEHFKYITEDTLKNIVNALKYVEKQYPQEKEVFSDCLSELNSGILMGIYKENKQDLDMLNSPLLTKQEILTPYLEEKIINNLASLSSKKVKTKDDLKNIDSNLLRTVLRKSKDEDLYEWFLKKYKEGAIKQRAVERLDLGMRIRLFVKSNGEIESLEEFRWVTEKELSKAFERSELTENFFPYKEKRTKVLKEALKEDLSNWHQNEFKQMMLEKELKKMKLIDGVWTKENEEWLQEVMREFFKPFEEIKSIEEFDLNMNIKELKNINKEYYEKLKEKYGIELEDVIRCFLVEKENKKEKEISEMLDLEMFDRKSEVTERGLKVTFLDYLKEKRKDLYEDLLKDKKTGLLKYLKRNNHTNSDTEQDYYIDQFFYQLETNSLDVEILPLLVTPRLSMNADFFSGYTEYKGDKINLAKTKSLLMRTEKRNRNVNEQLKEVAMKNIEVIKTENFTKTWIRLENGLLNKKQQIEVLFKAYPVETTNIFLLNGIIIENHEELKRTLEKIKQEELEKVLEP